MRMISRQTTTTRGNFANIEGGPITERQRCGGYPCTAARNGIGDMMTVDTSNPEKLTLWDMTPEEAAPIMEAWASGEDSIRVDQLVGYEPPQNMDWRDTLQKRPEGV